jgi:serine/threonine-protein kinase RsbW
MTASDGKPAGDSLDITSDLENVRRARRWVSDRLETAGYPGEMVADILLAVGEALTNIVRHAYGGRPGQPIHLRLTLGPDAVEIALGDESPRSFDARAVSAPRPEDLAEGGYGLHLIHTLMDDVRYTRAGNGGTVVHLLKQVPLEPRKAAS